jgi:2-methylcitrate dehydratase PrpD
VGIARQIAEFVVALSTNRMPVEVREKLDTCLVNGFGVALAALAHPTVAASRAAVLSMDGEQPKGATLLGDGRRTSVSGATFANSAVFYGGGQCDTCGTVHIGPIVLPMLLAMVEAGGYPLARLREALCAGYEVSGLLDKHYGVHSAALGFRATPLYGTLGAAAAAAKMMGLDVEQTESALAIAASFTGGLLQGYNDGTAEVRHQPGIAARNGLAAAEVARAGTRGAPYALEGPAGLIAAFARQPGDAAALGSTLGRDWSVLRVTFKPYPVCAFNQTPVTAALALKEKVRVDDIVALRVRMNPYETGYAGMDSKGPFTSLTGTVMSIPFCIALTLMRGAPYTIRPLMIYDDPLVNSFVPKVDLVTDPTVANLSAVLEADLADGRTVVQDQRMTYRDYTFSRRAISEQVRRIGRDGGVPQSAYDAIERFVDDLPAGDLRQVIAAFASMPDRRAAA